MNNSKRRALMGFNGFDLETVGCTTLLHLKSGLIFEADTNMDLKEFKKNQIVI